MTTRWYHYVFAFIAGALIVNMLPHLINGISGKPFPSPFSEPPGIGLSSPVSNVAWATINFLLAAAFVYFGKLSQQRGTIILGYVAGGLLMAFYLAHYFGGLDTI